MRNIRLNIIVMGVSLCISVLTFAQQQLTGNSADLTASSGGSENAAPEEISTMEQSYADMAKLNQQVEFAKRELQSRGLQQDIANMRLAQEQRSLGFNVASIEGFDTRLFAKVVGENGGVFQVEPGGTIGDNYRVSRLTASEMQVIDTTTRKVYTVPFLKLKSSSASLSANKVSVAGSGANASLSNQKALTAVSATTTR